MRVTRYQAHHVLGIKDIDFKLEGHHLYLVGGENEQGKTSALTALLMALCGRSGMNWPDIALREGEDEGWVKVKLTPHSEDEIQKEYEVELFLKRKRSGQVIESFRIVDESGADVPQPRTLLQRLYSLEAFDPLAFEKLPAAKKRELLMKLAGLDFTEDEKEYKRLFQERTDVNRDGKRLKAKWEGMPEHKDAPDAPADLPALLNEKDDREEKRRAKTKAEYLLREKLSETARLQGLIEQKRQELVNLEEGLERAVIEAEAQQKTVDVMETPDVEEIGQQILEAEEKNRKYRENEAKQTAGKELDRLRAKSQELTDTMSVLRDKQAEAIRTAAWPVKGLSVDDDGVLYGGLPFEQVAKSKRILLSAQIGMALNPRLRLLVCQDGNDLGKRALGSLQKLLESRDYQMILELVTRTAEDESRCAVVIEDGRVSRTEDG